MTNLPKEPKPHFSNTSPAKGTCSYTKKTVEEMVELVRAGKKILDTKAEKNK